MELDSLDFCKSLPKVELHAHLTGSLSHSTVRKLLAKKQKDCPDFELPPELQQTLEKPGESYTLEDALKMLQLTQKLTTDPVSVKEAAVDVIHEFAEDNVKYLELRSTPRNVDKMTKEQYEEALIQAVRECKDSVPSITVKLLVSIDRRVGAEGALDVASMACKLHTMYPDEIVGMDVSGPEQETDGRKLLPALQKARNQGLKVAVHLAESPDIRHEEIEAVLDWRPDRIGHGTCLHPAYGGSPQILNQMNQYKIPLELCLTSNVLCKTVESYQKHHFQHWWRLQHPITLATDDKGFFNCTLSSEYDIARSTFNLSTNDLKELSRNSISYTFTDEHNKTDLLKNFA